MNLSDFGANDNPALREIIARSIRAAGSIPFSEFYGLALYHPVHGYYLTSDPAQDYQSSPNLHPVFGATLARHLISLWQLLDRPARFDVFEAGANSGRLAGDILRALRIQSPDLLDAIRYVVQDVSLTGDTAVARLEATGLSLDKVDVAEALPKVPEIEGCILSNELLDALPFERVRVRDGRLYGLNVAMDGERFIDVEVPAMPEVEAYFAALGILPGEGCDAEVSLKAIEWTRQAAGALKRGYLLTLDYGYEAPQLYASWRKRGTLLTFYRHTSSDDPYVRIGRQDITASVDFTSVIRTGETAGLQTLGLTTQTDFLAALGIGEALQQPPSPGDIEAYYALRRAVMELMDSSGLGRIRVLLQGRDVPLTLPAGFLPSTR